ncbi:MAG: hypothetical protein CMA11_04105 [Euryarchaeota archaeon]|nr:hypothetical protein [Euryarchaeota archaeon]
MRTLFGALVIILIATPVTAHELSIYTITVNSSGAQPSDIPNGSLKEGDTAWFWMKDSTNNTSLVIEIERDGATLRSPVLVYQCELDENGTLVDEDCQNRFDYTFNQHNSAGLWNITYLKYVNETLTETINGSVFIEQDIHDQQPVEEEDEVVSASKYSTNQIIAMAIAAISLMAIFVILFMNEESQE